MEVAEASGVALSRSPALAEELFAIMKSGVGGNATKLAAGAIKGEFKFLPEESLIARFPGHSALHSGPRGVNVVGKNGHRLAMNEDQFQVVLPDGTNIRYANQTLITRLSQGDTVVQTRLQNERIATMLNGKVVPHESEIALGKDALLRTNSASNSHLVLADKTEVYHATHEAAVHTGKTRVPPFHFAPEHEFNVSRDYLRSGETAILKLNDLRPGHVAKYYDTPTFLTHEQGMMLRNIGGREWYQSVDTAMKSQGISLARMSSH